MTEKNIFDPVKWLTDLIDWIGLQYKNKKAIDLNVHDSLCTAFLETYNCLADLKSKGKNDTDLDEGTWLKLSALWWEAATHLREIDDSFYQACWQKSKYWRDPKSWTANSIESSGCSLEQLELKIESFRKNRISLDTRK